MTALPVLAAVHPVMKVVMVIFILCALALILIVLIQKGRGGGLSGAFGGLGSGGLLGSKTGDFLTWFTIGLVGLFLMLCVIMAKFYKPRISDFGPGQASSQPAAPVQSPVSGQPAVPAMPDDSNSLK